MSIIAHLKIKKGQEKHRNIILSIAFLLIAALTAGIFTFRNYPSDKENMNLSINNGNTDKETHPKKQKVKPAQPPKTDAVETEIIAEKPDDTYPPEEDVANIAETTPEESLESSPEASPAASGRAAIYIPQTRSLLFQAQNRAPDQIQTGKVYYESEYGKLESSIIRDRTGIREELTAYNEKGNAVDKLEIGYICDSAKHVKCAVIFKNKISIYETKLSADNKNEEIVTEYLISPQMKFSRGKTYKKL
ncbi:MAG: hypothetical protein LBC48_01375 [Dysgonamonadaceae bacterium]|nr:hypothetical protein [Dysgonamonadaceae bacterium]